MKKIVLTGGPCGGKTTVKQALQDEFRGQVLLVPEIATILLEGGFPVPGRDIEWSEVWQTSFQSAVLPLQRSMEEAYSLQGRASDHKLLVCDRGILDGAAYTPGGVQEFARLHGVDIQAVVERYLAVIHLESLATADPSKYGSSNNEHRFEPLERAQELELTTRSAWSMHPRHIVIDGVRGIEGKVSEVIGIVRYLLTG